MGGVEVVTLTASEAFARAGQLWAVEREALGAATGAVVGPEQADRIRLHTGRADFAAVAALLAGEVVGFGYGYVEEPGSWWRGYVEPALVAAGQGEWLDRAFTLTELHVLPTHQGHGVGLRLLRDLLAGVAQDSVLLSTQAQANPSRGFYDRLGFTELARADFPGQPRYAVLGRRLPLI